MVCDNFAYPRLMYFFEEISRIPRESYHEEKISEYIEAFAKIRGLKCFRDALGNVLIDLPASEDKKDKEPLLLQGHMDMVCEKNEGVLHDFSHDPLKLYVKDGWLRAEGTTLGADNGVAIAVMLCLLDSPPKSHRAMQCLFTVSEEVGLDGAKAFDYSRIYARRMINMDSADESMIIAGCAGGLRSSLVIPIDREEVGGSYFKLSLKGLFGGHSGEDIHRGRANANKLMGRVLARLLFKDPSMRLVKICGGTKENAIPREAEAIISSDDFDILLRCLDCISEEIKGELTNDDRGFSLNLTECEDNFSPMTKEGTEKVIFILSAISNGVFEKNALHPAIVEFSRNLGIVETAEAEVTFIINSRSARESHLDLSESELDLYARYFGGRAEHFNRYPGWIYAEHSQIRDEYIEAYREIFSSEPRIEVIHAGLECGIIKKLVPDMDMLSCGPIVVNLHSPDEALELASFERFFSIIERLV